MEMIEQFSSRDDANIGIKVMLENKEKIMGFGHAVYSNEDPRNKIVKAWSERLSKTAKNPIIYEISEEIEKVMKEEKNLFANTDFYMASAYNFLGCLLYTSPSPRDSMTSRMPSSA